MTAPCAHLNCFCGRIGSDENPTTRPADIRENNIKIRKEADTAAAGDISAVAIFSVGGTAFRHRASGGLASILENCTTEKNQAYGDTSAV